MLSKPAWTFIGTAGQNIWSGARLPPKAVVCHIMQGTLAGCDTWFSAPQAQASTNFGIGKDGTIHCYVDPQGVDAPFANGIVDAPDATFKALQAQNPQNPNYWTVSVEHEGNSGDVVPAAQFTASVQLTAWLCQQFAIAPDHAHIIGHFEIDSVNRAGCPGWTVAFWAQYVAAVAALVSPPAPGPDPLQPEVTKLTAALTGIQQAAAAALA